nr:AAC(3)-I family aminoglycoside N-acetyltransferase [Sphingomonas sp. SFZ2018-12]
MGPGDVTGVRRLNALFAEAFEDAEHYAAAPPPDAWLDALLARDDVIALVAEADGAVVGGLVAYVLAKFEQARREIYIYDLAVAEVHRRQGVATALIAEVRRIAGEIGASTVFVQADVGDDPAIALYAGLGSRLDAIHFDMAPL